MAEFRDRSVNLLVSKYSKRLYAEVKDLPIIDYHCHLSPKEIYEDKPFENIGVMWLQGDHYKWRLMRGAGVDEKYITGSADWWEKFYQFAKVAGTAYGNPIKDWCALELSFFFGINTPLNEATAQDIWNRANKVISSRKLSPRKLIRMANVEYIATTDDPCDTLEYHDLIAKEGKLNAKVVPSFRVDNLVLARASGYGEYIAKLGKASGVDICDIATLKEAILKRMDYFVERGCKFSDVDFPSALGKRAKLTLLLRS